MPSTTQWCMVLVTTFLLQRTDPRVRFQPCLRARKYRRGRRIRYPGSYDGDQRLKCLEASYLGINRVCTVCVKANTSDRRIRSAMPVDEVVGNSTFSFNFSASQDAFHPECRSKRNQNLPCVSYPDARNTPQLIAMGRDDPLIGLNIPASQITTAPGTIRNSWVSAPPETAGAEAVAVSNWTFFGHQAMKEVIAAFGCRLFKEYRESKRDRKVV